MARLFGTDGIRGVANVDLTPTLAFALGRAVAHRLAAGGRRIVIGQDTRRSGDMFVAALAAGATSLGADVDIAGVVPTPGLAYVTAVGEFAAGIMVSASHNAPADNGLKVLDAAGRKLDDAIEEELEALIGRSSELGGSVNAELGRVRVSPDLLELYAAHRRRLATGLGDGLRVVLDCANGSGGVVGPQILAASGATVEVVHNAPDGTNINVDCGATAPGSLAQEVLERGADLGFALDGDADRLVAVDAAGRVVDGDQILGLCALERLRSGRLPGGLLVVSVLSNGGLQNSLEAAGGRLIRTPVGDKYILEAMEANGAGLGGEKSGHVIVSEHSLSGDGIVTALEVLRVIAARKAPLAALADEVPLLPQEQRTIPARHKASWEADRIFTAHLAAARERLGGAGRILVRPSGTEPVLRLMIEGPDGALVGALADEIASIAGERLN